MGSQRCPGQTDTRARKHQEHNGLVWSKVTLQPSRNSTHFHPSWVPQRRMGTDSSSNFGKLD
jgi:hypothetical protein